MTPTGPQTTAEPRAAAAPARIRAQARFETETLLRNGEQLLVALVLPALALVGLALSGVPSLGEGPRIDIAVPGVFALAIVSTAFTGQAIQTGFDRRYGVLRLLGTTPLGRDGLLAGKAVAVLVVELVQVVVLGGLGFVLGWRPSLPFGALFALVVGLVGTWAFVAFALLLAGTVRAEAVLAVANLVWVLVLALGVLTPTALLPGPLAALAPWLPPGALGDGLRAALVDGRLDLGAVLTLAVWGVLASVLASRTFRWSD